MYTKNIDYDLELEASVLGICIAEPSAFGNCYNLLNEECFYGFDHKEVYKGLHTLFNNGSPIDMIILSRYFYDKRVLSFKENGEITVFIIQLMTGVVSSAHLEHWCLLLRELAAKRLMIEITHSGIKSGDAFDNAKDIDERLKKIFEIRSTDDWQHISQVAITATQDIESRDRNVIPGISTSISILDKINGGFRPDDLIVIGARPSVGKSAFMGRIATQTAFRGKTVGIISLEMANTPIFTRMVAADSETEFYRIDRNDLGEETQRKHVYNTISKLAALPIYFSDTAQVDSTDIRAKAEKLKRKNGLDLLVIDYLQLIEPDSDKRANREQQVSKISRDMKNLAKTLHIPVILLAQLNRAVTEKDKPQLHHLRESGAIEQDADVVMFLHRDYMTGKVSNENGESTEYEADLLIRKWRNGAPTEIKIGFDPKQMRFYDLDAESFKKTDFSIYNNPNKGIPQNYNPNHTFEPDKKLPF